MKKIILFAFLLGNVALYGQSTVATINKGYKLNAGQYLDTRMGTILAGKSVPYSGVSAANAAIFPAFRCVGMTVLIDTLGSLKEYWYLAGTANGNLVPKETGSTYTFTNRITNTSGTVSIDTATNQNVYNATHASFWGDSFTGNGTYVSFFEKLTGIKAYNGGIGGETSIQIKARFDAAPIKHTQPTVIWAGRNNIGDTTQIKNDINAMVAALGHNRYLVVSILPSANDVGGSAGNLVNIAAVNTYLSNVYGTRYINAYTFLRANGDGSVNDNADITAGFIPRSLRFAGDGLHINEKGDSLVAALMYAKKDILTPSYGVTVANTLATVQSTTDDVSTTNISSLYTGYNTGRFAITPQYSTGYGFNALKRYSSGIRMTALGSYAASNITTASDATIVGASAGQYASNLTQSTVVGSNAGLVGGEDLTAIGWYSYPSLTSGLRNTGLGGKTGFSLTAGSDNLLAGYSAGSGITTGNNNAYLGSYAGNATTTASNNVGIGFYAMVNNTTGSETVAIGTNALQSNTTGINNVSVGVNSLAFNTASSNNTAVGYGAMNNPTSGGSNTAIGNSSLKFMAGSNNIGIGSNAGAYAISGSNQIFLNSIDRGTATGDSTLSILYGYQSATIANQKLRVNGFLQINDATQGSGKVFTSDANGVGSWQTPSSASGWSLTGNAGTTAGTNFIGTTDGQDPVFKRNNTFSGRIGSSDTYFGLSAGALSHSGGSNTAIGASALAGITGASQNTAVGVASLLNLTSGSNNTSIGAYALRDNTTGGGNIAIGIQAGYYNTTLSNQIFINSINRTNFNGDTTASPIYIVQNSTVANQRTKVNGWLQINDATQGSGKVFTSDANGVGSWQTPSGGGTVTSVATGYGVSGGTITTSGTIVADTTTSTGLVSKDRLTNALALKVNISDTAAMLSPYLRAVGLGLTKSGQTVLADTTVLSSKTYSAALAALYVPLAGATYTTTTGNGLALTTSTLTTGNLVSLASTGTAAGSNTQNVLRVATSGANGTSTQTTYGQFTTNTHTGTTSTNVAGYFSASGGTNNYSAIFENGSVGIGTTAPASTFELVGGDNPFLTSAYGANNAGLVGRKAQGTQASPTAVTTDNFLTFLSGCGYQSTGGFSSNAAIIAIKSAQGFTSTANGTYMTFETTPLSSITRGEVMRISAEASVGIGTGATIAASAILALTSTTKGFLPPKMTATQGSAISSPAEGLLIYVTDTNGTFTAKGWWGYDGAAWQKLNN